MNSFSFSSIKGKLLLLSGVSVLVLTVLVSYSLFMMSELKDSVNLLGQQRIPIATFLGDIRAGTHAVPRYVWLSHAQPPGSAKRAEALKLVDEYLEKLKNGLDKYDDYQISAESLAKVKAINLLIPKLTEVINNAKKMLEVGTKAKDEAMREYVLTELNPITLQITTLSRELADIAKTRNTEIVQVAEAHVELTKKIMTSLSLVLIICLMLFSWVFSNKLSHSLSVITESVSEASNQVSSASDQLSGASEQLSSASQQQASSLEETSASLTEISGMVDANVRDAEKANDLAKSAFNISEATKNSMNELSKAMSTILEGNVRIEKLVKVIEEIGEKTEIIDDIVFKTQLLSFNASVEAERAGEHGRGFAVVAQEVGNLAQMSGKAALEISSIVKNSIKEAESVATENKTLVEHGGRLADDTKLQMVKVLEQLGVILENMNKIVVASREQSQGIGQISTSVESLSRATQETASTSEESASASVELAGQAQSLLSLVESLRTIINGKSATEEIRHNVYSIEKPTIKMHKKIHKPTIANNVVKMKKAVGGNVAAASDEWEKL